MDAFAGEKAAQSLSLHLDVGGFAAAMAAHVRDCWPVQPSITIVEPNADLFVTVADGQAEAAACTYASHGIRTMPSSAATLAALQDLAPGPDARCLLIATEGPETV